MVSLTAFWVEDEIEDRGYSNRNILSADETKLYYCTLGGGMLRGFHGRTIGK